MLRLRCILNLYAIVNVLFFHFYRVVAGSGGIFLPSVARLAQPAA
jgi:hypothetical protein